MKIQYICESSAVSKERVLGVNKKITSEIKAFERAGLIVKLTPLQKKKRIIAGLPFNSKWDYGKLVVDTDTDVIYLRYPFCDYLLLKAMKSWKKKNPHRRIMIELPSYPHDKELSHHFILTTIRELFYRRYLSKYADLAVIYTDFDSVFGIKAVKLYNCVDVDAIKLSPDMDKDRDAINLIMVAQLAFWHGCDRVIEGLRHYYENGGNRDIYFHIVGEGSVLEKLKKQVQECGLETHVIFYGYRNGEELDAVYSIADIGIDAIGAHRKEDTWFGSLKSMEYMARGVPFITESVITKALDTIQHFIMSIPFDETYVDMEEVVQFYDGLRTFQGDIRASMRGFAEGFCDYKVAMNPVIDYIKNFENPILY